MSSRKTRKSKKNLKRSKQEESKNSWSILTKVSILVTIIAGLIAVVTFFKGDASDKQKSTINNSGNLIMDNHGNIQISDSKSDEILNYLSTISGKIDSIQSKSLDNDDSEEIPDYLNKYPFEKHLNHLIEGFYITPQIKSAINGIPIIFSYDLELMSQLLNKSETLIEGLKFEEEVVFQMKIHNDVLKVRNHSEESNYLKGLFRSKKVHRVGSINAISLLRTGENKQIFGHDISSTPIVLIQDKSFQGENAGMNQEVRFKLLFLFDNKIVTRFLWGALRQEGSGFIMTGDPNYSDLNNHATRLMKLPFSEHYKY